MLEVKLKEAISVALNDLYAHKLKRDEISLQPTRKEFEGTYTFVTFPFSRISKVSPEQTGYQIGESLRKNCPEIVNFNVVKGFLNLMIADHTWVSTLAYINSALDFGIHPSTGQKVMIEFSSPNTNKPLHLGHLRNNFLGDAMSRIFEASGYEVLKVNLVNDRGIHICKSMYAYQKQGNNETPESSGLKGDHLVGKYYVKFDQMMKSEIELLLSKGKDKKIAEKEAPSLLESQAMLKKWEDGDADTVMLWEKMNGWVYEGFDATYTTMGIEFHKTYKESNTYLLGKNIIEEGLRKGVFFEKEDGSVWIDLTEDGLDEKIVRRADGTAVYMTQDMGTCDMKYQNFPFDRSIFVVGNEQDYHFKVLFTIMKKLGRKYADGLYHLSYGMVDLPNGKMKSREGSVIDADDLIQEMFDTAQKHTIALGKNEGIDEKEAEELYKVLGLGALKYFLLRVDPKKKMLFNPQESIEFQGHTGPFIQYTHARISALLRRAKTLQIESAVMENLKLNAQEADLIYRLSEFPNMIKAACNDYSPAILAQYIFDLAKDYNSFYQEFPIFGEEDVNIKQLRIALSSNTAKVINKGMELLGIKVPERM